jgi:hypothetical protein
MAVRDVMSVGSTRSLPQDTDDGGAAILPAPERLPHRAVMPQPVDVRSDNWTLPLDPAARHRSMPWTVQPSVWASGPVGQPLSLATHIADVDGLGYVRNLSDTAGFLSQLRERAIHTVGPVADGTTCQSFSRLGRSKMGHRVLLARARWERT